MMVLQSIKKDGITYYIEVKGTRKSKNNKISFNISSFEVEMAMQCDDINKKYQVFYVFDVYSKEPEIKIIEWGNIKNIKKPFDYLVKYIFDEYK